MTLEPNLRNGKGWSTGPHLWSTDTHEYAAIVTLDWNGIVAQRPHGGAWSTFDLSTVTGNPLALPINSADDHNRLAICVDGLGYIHIAGNMHTHEMRYVVSAAPNDITAWSAGTMPDLSLTGDVNGLTYPTFTPLPDGTVYLSLSQNDRTVATPLVLGRDVLLFHRGPTATAWTPENSNGEFAICNETASDGDPERVYFAGRISDNDGTLHVFLLWQMAAEDPSTRTHLSYVRRTSAGQWESITGDPVTLPLTLPKCQAATSCVLPNQLTHYVLATQMTLTVDGHPHWAGQDGNVPINRRRHWWDGSAWQNASYTGGTYTNIRGTLWRARGNTGRVVLTDDVTGATVTMSGDVPTLYDSMPDPVRALDGTFAVLAPYGDTPKVFTFGNHARMSAGA